MIKSQKKIVGGGWHSIKYTLKMGWRVGFLKLFKAMRTKNACKTCALGMGGQKGGMVNESGEFPELCKKTLQAMVADMAGSISESFFKKYSAKNLASLTSKELEEAGRIVFPLLKRKDSDHYEKISWSEALNKVSSALHNTDPDRSFFYFSGRSSMEAGFLLQLFARIYGTNHVNNCSFYCHQASGVGLSSSIGSGTATVDLEGMEKSDLVILLGANPACNHPRFIKSIQRVRSRGGKVVVINPVKEPGLVRFKVPSVVSSFLGKDRVSDLYIQPKVGGDSHLLLALCKRIFDKECFDRKFVENHTSGFEDFSKALTCLDVDGLIEEAGVDSSSFGALFDLYANCQDATFCWAMGITHHVHGVANVHNIVNLALMRGMVGRPNAGLLPLRGHSNVQGMGTVGVTPRLKKQTFEAIEKMGVKLPTFKGYDTMSCMNAAERGEVDVAISLGGNLYGSNPDLNYARKSLSKIALKVYMSTTLNSGHACGLGEETLILPVKARDEESEKTTQESMFNYVRVSDGGRERYEGPRSEVDVINSIGELVLGPKGVFNWSQFSSHQSIRSVIAKTIPELSPLANIDKVYDGGEFVIEGRLKKTPVFSTESGKAHFNVHPLPSLGVDGDELKIISVRSEGQFNTVVYEEEDVYRGQERRDVILMNAQDMKNRSLRADDLVSVNNDVGTLNNIRVRPFDVSQGTALMYFPEVNEIIPRTLDPISQTPAFKGFKARVVR